MAFRRTIEPAETPGTETLTAQMIGIGMNFEGRSDPMANIEDTLLFASIEGMDHDDLRVLSVLVTWLGVHHERINVDRLVRLVGKSESVRVRAFWKSIGEWLVGDRRFAKMKRFYRGPRIELLSAGTEFQIKRRGEDERFAGSAMRVPAGTLRDRPADVLTPTELARVHASYRQRIVSGPSYRADAWAALQRDASLSPSQLARSTYASFATAWQTKRDWTLLRQCSKERTTLQLGHEATTFGKCPISSDGAHPFSPKGTTSFQNWGPPVFTGWDQGVSRWGPPNFSGPHELIA